MGSNLMAIRHWNIHLVLLSKGRIEPERLWTLLTPASNQGPSPAFKIDGLGWNRPCAPVFSSRESFLTYNWENSGSSN